MGWSYDQLERTPRAFIEACLEAMELEVRALPDNDS